MGAGITFKSAKITRISSKDRYSMNPAPGLEWDRSDDLLDPSKGGSCPFK
jgi:hypothetical protein